MLYFENDKNKGRRDSYHHVQSFTWKTNLQLKLKSAYVLGFLCAEDEKKTLVEAEVLFEVSERRGKHKMLRLPH